MRIDRPEPGAQRQHGEPSTPRPAATVVLLRGSGTLEVLMVQRTPNASFMAGFWVFPGGTVEPEDGPGNAGIRQAGRRELEEEAGIVLPDSDALVPYARWITPAELKRRFDAWFFLAQAPAEHPVVVDGGEIVDHRWISPQAALAAQQSGEMPLAFPTIKTLQTLLPYGSADEALKTASERPVAPLQPRLVGDGDDARITLPGDPGYSAT